MHDFDEYGNHIATSRFETQLSLFLVSHPHFYQEIYAKINQAIIGYINSNNQDRAFDRKVYCLFSNVSVLFPAFQNTDDLLKKFNLEAHTEFHKQFCEAIFDSNKVAVIPKRNPNKVHSLVELCQFSLALRSASKKKNQLRPPHLFSGKNRSRKETSKTLSGYPYTTKFGISSEMHTPAELTRYFQAKFQPAQCQFRRDPEGDFSKWLVQRNLPFVSGPSGTLEILFNSLNMLLVFNRQELASYIMAIAAATVARGHHSFAEVMIVANKLGFGLKDCDSQRAFYEQFLTPEVLNSPEYKQFVAKSEIENYFKEYDAAFRSSTNPRCLSS